jgi:hypothetical protein
LLDVHGKAPGCVQPPWTHITLEVLRLLVLHEDWWGVSTGPSLRVVSMYLFHLQIRARNTSTKDGLSAF